MANDLFICIKNEEHKVFFFFDSITFKKDLKYKEVDRKESLKYILSACILVNNPNVSNEFKNDGLTLQFGKIYDKYQVKESIKIRIKREIWR